MDLKNLETDWCVQRSVPYSNKNWKRFINWLNNKIKGSSDKLEGLSNFYGFQNNSPSCSSYRWGKVYSLEEFIEALDALEWKPKQGEEVEVKTHRGLWEKRIFLCEIPNCVMPYVCVDKSSEEKYRKNEKIYSSMWQEIRKLQPKIEIDISIKVNGIEKDPKDFTDEEWLTFKNK